MKTIIGLISGILLSFFVMKLFNIKIVDIIFLIIISFAIGFLINKLFSMIFLRFKEDLSMILFGITAFSIGICLNIGSKYFEPQYPESLLLFWIKISSVLVISFGFLGIIFGIKYIVKGTNINSKNLNEHANEKLTRFSIKLEKKKIPRSERKKQLEQFRDELLKDKKNIDPKL